MATKRLYFLSTFLIACWTLSVNADDVKYDKYLNGRFAYGISYPAGILLPQGEADNGDGQQFLSKDQRTSMLVYGCNNAMNSTLKGLFQHEIDGDTSGAPKRAVTYRVLTNNWFVVSGTEGDMIFYTKVLHNAKQDQFMNFRITYPSSQSEFYNPIVSVISRSMKILSVSFRGCLKNNSGFQPDVPIQLGATEISVKDVLPKGEPQDYD